MPIQEKNLGKYKRPDIYIEETNNAIVDSPAQNVLINLIPGFSKKGPVNNPTYVDNKIDFQRIFGTIDRQLENKDSYFHRTCEKMLETGPVWALNLLSTLPDRDILKYVSIAESPSYTNSSFTNQYTADYERFFNRQDFWKRNADSFQDVVDDPTADTSRLLHLTNMGDKVITVFMFKSDVKGFDVTASDWYGGDTFVPTYMHPKQLISDWMVDVLVISGDWTDYNALSVDSTWSTYFTSNGLIITGIQDFVNEVGVTVLASYDACLIPNFKDSDGRDMYIENLINNDTDKTGLFCSYNQDLLLDSDYLTDKVDLIGDTIVGTDTASINFLSYNQSIKEDREYPLVNLDATNNVFGTTDFGSKTHAWDNWSTSSIQWSSFNNTTLKAQFDTGTYIINGVQYTLGSDTYVDITTLTDGYKRLDVIYLDSTGMNVMDGTAVVSGGTIVPKSIDFTNTTSIILGTLEVLYSGSTYYDTYTPITVDVSGYVAPTIAATEVSGLTNSYVNVTFTGTSGSTVRDSEYARLRLTKLYTEISTTLENNKGVIIESGSTYGKLEITDPTSTSYTTTADATIKIYATTPATYISGTDFLLYYIDNEFDIQDDSITLTTDYTGGDEVVAKYSSFYLDYINGEISNGDYFYDSDDTTQIILTMYINSNNILTVNFSSAITTVTSSGITVSTDIGSWKQTIEIENYSQITDTTNTLSIYVNKSRYSEIKRGYFLEAYYDETYYGIDGDGPALGDTIPRKLTRIVNITNDTVDTSLKILWCDAPIKISTASSAQTEYYTTTYPAIYNYATHLKGINLAPFKIHADSIPNGTETRQNSILDVMALNTPLFNGLVNKNKISWRYLIDPFGLGLDDNSKQQYLDLCGKKINCLGFINMPSAKTFKKSSNPSFTNDDGSLNMEFIRKGGDEDKNPDFLYSFGEGVGKSTVGYFFPYVDINDNGVGISIPPAANMATAYMKKHITNIGGVYEWTIVAGVNMGRITDISSTEIDFTDADLDELAEMGANPIRFIRNIGYIINDENTAQVFPISSLSYMHSRELLIELENELYDMLLRYQWKFNTATVRSEIKYKADRICQRYLDSSGLYNYKNICDETNNSNYIIDLQGGVLDTHVEIVKGMGFIVNNITIEKTGAINSSGFQA